MPAAAGSMRSTGYRTRLTRCIPSDGAGCQSSLIRPGHARVALAQTLSSLSLAVRTVRIVTWHQD